MEHSHFVQHIYFHSKTVLCLHYLFRLFNWYNCNFVRPLTTPFIPSENRIVTSNAVDIYLLRRRAIFKPNYSWTIPSTTGTWLKLIALIGRYIKIHYLFISYHFLCSSASTSFHKLPSFFSFATLCRSCKPLKMVHFYCVSSCVIIFSGHNYILQPRIE